MPVRMRAILRVYPNNLVVMRLSEKPEAKSRPKTLGGVVCSTPRTFLADNAGIGLCSQPQ